MTECTLQRAMGARPVGVAIVCCNSPTGPQGLLVGTLASLSSDPPRVSFAVGRTAGPLAALRGAAAVTIQLLAPGQAEIAAQFSDSKRVAQRFEGAGWSFEGDAAPRLEGVCACVVGAPEAVYDLDTHALFVVAVSAAWRFGDATLLYQDGRFLA